MTKTVLEFRILVIVICLGFVICHLEFLFLQYSTFSLFAVCCKLPASGFHPFAETAVQFAVPPEARFLRPGC